MHRRRCIAKSRAIFSDSRKSVCYRIATQGNSTALLWSLEDLYGPLAGERQHQRRIGDRHPRPQFIYRFAQQPQVRLGDAKAKLEGFLVHNRIVTYAIPDLQRYLCCDMHHCANKRNRLGFLLSKVTPMITILQALGYISLCLVVITALLALNHFIARRNHVSEDDLARREVERWRSCLPPTDGYQRPEPTASAEQISRGA